MRFLGRMSSNYSPKAIYQRMLNKISPLAGRSSCYESGEVREWLAIPTKLIKIEDIATLNHLVEVVSLTVKNRQSKKCRTTLMISNVSVELILNQQNLFFVGLDQVVTCFSLPSEPRAIALVYRKGSADGYCCACLMLNDALTSLSGWQVWEILTSKQTFFMIRDMNRKFTAQTHLIHNTCDPQPPSISSLKHSLSDTAIDLSTSAIQPSSIISSSVSSLSCITSPSSFDSQGMIAQFRFTTLSSWLLLSSKFHQFEQASPISSSNSSISLTTISSSCLDESFDTASFANLISLSNCSEEDRYCLDTEFEETCQEPDVDELHGILQDFGPEVVSSSDSTDEVEGDDIASKIEPACDEDTDSGVVFLAGSDVQPSNSDSNAAVTGTTIVDDCSHARAEEIHIDIIDDNTAPTPSYPSASCVNHAEVIGLGGLEENVHSSVVNSAELVQSQVSIYTEDESPADSGNTSGNDISGFEEVESDPNEPKVDTEPDIPQGVLDETDPNPECKVELSSNMDIVLSSIMAYTGVSTSNPCSKCENIKDNTNTIESKTLTDNDLSQVKVNSATEAVDNAQTHQLCHSYSSEVSSCDENTSAGRLLYSDGDCDEGKSIQLDSKCCIENALCSDSDGSDGSHSDGEITETESEFCPHNEFTSEETVSNGNLSSCAEKAYHLDRDSDEGSDGSMIESEDSFCSCDESESREIDSNSSSSGSCDYGERVHCTDDVKSDEDYSDGSTTESGSDSCSNDNCRSHQTGYVSDSYSCGEKTHSSDGDDSDETNSNSRITDSDSDSCSCSSYCCSCDECCSCESDSDVYCDSDSSYSEGDTADSDYDGDDEDDEESQKHSKYQPVTGISSQFSNKTVRLIRVRNVGLVVMAVTKDDQDSVRGRNSMETSSSLQMLKRLGREISFKRLPC